MRRRFFWLAPLALVVACGSSHSTPKATTDDVKVVAQAEGCDLSDASCADTARKGAATMRQMCASDPGTRAGFVQGLTDDKETSLLAAFHTICPKGDGS